jgi:hypothetical protein
MKKPQTKKHQAVKQLKICIRESRKVARRINKLLEHLAGWNKAKASAQDVLVKLCDLHPTKDCKPLEGKKYV